MDNSFIVDGLMFLEYEMTAHDREEGRLQRTSLARSIQMCYDMEDEHRHRRDDRKRVCGSTAQ